MFRYILLLVIGVVALDYHVLSASVHQTKEQFAKDVLAVHNEHRKVHNGNNSELELDDELSKKAQKKAEDAARDSDVLEEVGSGENLFMACSTYNRALTGREVTDSWYDEVCHPSFSFTKPDNKQARSFTQVVWKNSKKLGVGHAVTRKEHTICTYAVAMYQPTGNVLDFFEGNVTKGSFKSDKYCKNLIDDGGAKVIAALKQKKDFIGRRKITLSADKDRGTTRSVERKTIFTLNKNPTKSNVNRRTLYYKIPVNFVTSLNTGSTFAVPSKPEKYQQEIGARRSEPSAPPYQTGAPNGENEAQMDAINYGYAYHGNTNYKPTEESPPSSYDSVENGDVQADYMKEKLDQNSDSTSLGNLKLGYFEQNQPNAYENENYDNNMPSLETIPMTRPVKKTVEDEYALNKVALNVHNALRKMHGVPPLTLSAKMSIDAENYAKYLAENNKFEHAKDRGDDGENLAFSCNSEERIPSVYKAIKDWYEEVCTKSYVFQNDSGSSETAHFTQIVWKSTKQLGIGRSIVRRGEQTCTYFVARYSPSGNWMGDYTANVFPGSFTPTICDNLDGIIEKMAILADEEDGELTPEAVEAVKQKPTQTIEGNPPIPTKPGGQTEENVGLQVKPVDELNEDGSSNQGDIKPMKKPVNVSNIDELGESSSEDKCRFWSVEDLSKFASDSLKVHNYFRKLHNSPPLQIDRELVRQAFNGAKSICNDESKRSNAESVGENVETACNYDDVRISAADAVTNWYRQVCDSGYNFQNPKEGNGKFTQIVWKSSRSFGTAFVTKKKADGMFCTYVVAKYSPKGNQPGAYKENVVKGIFSPSICNSLNTLANNAAAKVLKPVKVVTAPQQHPIGAFDHHATNIAYHNAAKFEPFKVPLHQNVLHQHQPDIHQQHIGYPFYPKLSCANAGTNNPACRGQIEDEGLELHNNYRKIHHADDLSISNELSLAAQKIAEKLFQEKKSRLPISDDGENIAVQCRDSFTIAKAIKSWYKKVCDSDYDFAAEGDQDASQFTQLVWNDTKLLGIAKVSGNINGLRCTIIVAKYQPAGNIIGKFRKNVKQGDFKREDCDSFKSKMNAKTSNKQPGTNQVNGSLDNSQEAVDNENKGKRPHENKGINPKAGERRPPTTMPGETLKGAKQPNKKPKAPSGETPKPHLQTKDEATAFNNKCLEIHNALRALHGSRELHSSPDLVSKAQMFAEKIVNDGVLSQAGKREITSTHGQNTLLLCDSVKTDYSPEDIILKWYKDVCEKNEFIDGEYKGKLNHFTQIVWDGSTLFGMAKATFSTEKYHCTVAVALYRESGNFLNRLLKNVKQGDFDYGKCDFPDIILAEAEEKLREIKEAKGDSNSPNPSAKTPTTSSENLMSSPTPFTVFTVPQTTIEVKTTASPNTNSRVNEKEGQTERPNNQTSETKLPDKTKTPDDNKIPDDGKAPANTTVPDKTKTPDDDKVPDDVKEPDNTKVPVASESKPDTDSGQQNNEGSDYEKDALKAHNAYREIHDAEPLTLDSDLSAKCAEYAEKIAGQDMLKHSDSDDGENLASACRSTSELSAAEATRNWYKEVCDHNYNFAPKADNKNTGHFTQVVWKGTKKLGIGRYMKKKGSWYCTYVVARYTPAGNWARQYDDNVKRGSFDPDKTCKDLDKIAGVKSTKRAAGPTAKRNQVAVNKDSQISTFKIVNEEEGDAELSSKRLNL